MQKPTKIKLPDRQKAHSWMRVYANRRTPDYRGSKRVFEIKCRYVDMAQSRIRPVSPNSVKDGTYVLIIDNIEYMMDGNNPTAISDALKIHEAFYEKEFKEGGIKTIKTEEDLSKRWMYLRGISTRYNRGRSNTDYVQYVKATTIKGIAKWIANTLVRQGSYLPFDLSNMLWYIPGTPGTTIKLRSYVKEIVSQEKFDPEPDAQISSLYFYSSNYEIRDASRKARNTWIKKETKKIQKELQKLYKDDESRMKAKRMIADYKKRVA